MGYGSAATTTGPTFVDLADEDGLRPLGDEEESTSSLLRLTSSTSGNSDSQLGLADGGGDASQLGTDGPTPLITSAPGRRAGLPTRMLVVLTMFWFGYNLFYFALSIVTLPSEVKAIVGDDQKGFGMFVVFLASGIISLFASIILGYVTDRVYSPFGRRYSWMGIGSLILFPVAMLFPVAQSLGVYTLVYTTFVVLTVAISIPYNGLFADIVSNDQRGKASAILGAMMQIGYLGGALLGLFYTSLGGYGTYGIMLAIWAICLGITMVGVREPPFTRKDLERIRISDAAKRSHHLSSKSETRGIVYAWQWIYATVLFPLFEPMIINVDFRWVFMSRFLMQLGQATVQEFLQYYLSDCVALPALSEGGDPITPETAVSFLFLPLLIGAAISSVIGGFISDRLGNRRKILMYISGTTMVVSCVLLMFLYDFYVVTLLATLFGIGFGAFLSVDFAIVMDVLPSVDDVARDIGLWHLALVIPQIFATPLAGVLLDWFQDVGNTNNMFCLGYKVIFGLAALYIIIGTVMIQRIKKIR